MRSSVLEIFTDASYNHIECVAGFAYIISCDSIQIKKGGAIKGDPGNSKNAELICIANAIHKVISMSNELASIKYVNIYTDCLFAIKDISEKNRSVLGNKTKEAIIKLKQNMQAIRKGTVKFRIRHIKAHTSENDIGSTNNRWCDIEARKHMRLTIRNKNKPNQ